MCQYKLIKSNNKQGEAMIKNTIKFFLLPSLLSLYLSPSVFASLREDENTQTCFKTLKNSTPSTKRYEPVQAIPCKDGSQFTPYEAFPEKLPFGAQIGSDDRTPVEHPFEKRWAAHGHLEMLFPNGVQYTGSGTMIGQGYVLTAGHCLYNKKAGGWATSVKFSAAQNDSDNPVDPAYATQLFTLKGWQDRANSHFDMGMLVLDRAVGNETGWYGLSTDTDEFLKQPTLEVNVTGYPADTDKGSGKKMWTMSGKIRSVSPEQLTYTLDTTPGQSGSGVYVELNKPGEYYCVGIHTSGIRDQYNTATRITKVKFDRLVSWINKSWQ